MQEPSPPRGASSQETKPPSGAGFLGLALIVTARREAVPKIEEAIRELGVRIVFQCGPTTAPLYVLRHYQVEEILQGDLAFIREAHDRKSKERSVRMEK